MESRQHCIDILYRHVCETVYIAREVYEETLVGWDVQPIILDVQQIGVSMIRGTEIHISVTPENAIRHARRIIRVCLNENIKKLGNMTTISFKDAETVRFLERLGFYKTGEDETFFSYRIDSTKIH